jgi:hypothetical protein
MANWPIWLKVVLAILGVGGLIALSQVLLYLDRAGVSKFDL